MSGVTFQFSDFQNFCPLLAYVGAPVFNVFSLPAQDQVNGRISSASPNSAAMMACYITGHLMELSGYSVNGPTASVPAGPYSEVEARGIRAKFAVNDITPGELNGTFYGRAFKANARSFGWALRSASGKSAFDPNDNDAGRIDPTTAPGYVPSTFFSGGDDDL